MDDFVIFILTHGRPDKVKTLETLEKSGYTGDWYLVIDNEDEDLERYKAIHGEDKVIVFDKKYAMSITDDFSNSDRSDVVVYARNICFELAKKLNKKYFMELDDDYIAFQYRFPKGNKLGVVNHIQLNKTIEELLNFYKSTNIKTLAMCQGGDFIGGLDGTYQKHVLRKAMNTFICSVDRPFKFVGKINEDVNTYCLLGSQGDLFISITDLMVVQTPTQLTKNGLTVIYNEYGTYHKSFYSIMCCPSFVYIYTMGDKHLRIHHKIEWENAVPKIISSKYKK